MHFGTFHVEDDMGYSYEQVLNYEVARELINSHIADCSAALWDEREKATPDLQRIERIHEKMHALWIERGNMDMTDAAVAAVITKYQRRPSVGAAPQAAT